MRRELINRLGSWFPRSPAAKARFDGGLFGFREHLLDASQRLPCALFVLDEAESYVGIAGLV
jgi:hypothetical protein